MRVHVRTKPRGDFSFIESAAVKIGDDILQVASYGEYSLNAVDDAAIDGTKLGGAYSLSHQHESDKKHKFIISLGKDEAIVIKTHKDMLSVGIDNAGSVNFKSASGLMGSYEGLLLARDGVTIMDNHDLFGQEWQVMPEVDGEIFQTPSPNKGVCMPPQEAIQGRRIA